MTARTCRFCGQNTPEASGGRPPTYCSTGCRRAREYELRVASRRLEALQRQHDDLELEAALGNVTPDHLTATARAKLAARVETVASQIERYRTRLRDLLDDPEADDARS